MWTTQDRLTDSEVDRKLSQVIAVDDGVDEAGRGWTLR